MLAVLLPLLLVAAQVAQGRDDDALSLDAVRQFHSYTPGRQALPRQKQSRQSRGEKHLARARKSWKKGDYRTARKLLSRAVKAGNREAAWYLAHMYRTGLGGKVDHARALKYYRKVARLYDPDIRDRRWLLMTLDASLRVADYLRGGIDGKGRGRNLARAFQLYNLVAAHGHPAAYYGLAVITLSRNSSRQRQRMAVAWLKRAATGGHVPAAKKLARLAEKGLEGVLKPDPVAARAWRIIALRLAGKSVPATARTPQAQRASLLAERFLASIGRGGTAPAPPSLPASARP